MPNVYLPFDSASAKLALPKQLLETFESDIQALIKFIRCNPTKHLPNRDLYSSFSGDIAHHVFVCVQDLHVTVASHVLQQAYMMANCV